MATIAQANGVFTVIVVWPSTPESQQQLLDHLIAVADEHSRRPGFVSCSIHKSLDGTKIAEYIQWKDRASFEAMAQSTEGKAHIDPSAAIANAGIYEIVHVQESDRKEKQLTEIVPNTTLATLINVFTVAPENQQRLADILIEATESVMNKLPGFISANIHKSLDGTRVVNYAQWRSQKDYETMLTNLDAIPHMRLAAEIATSFEPRLYEVLFVDGPHER